MQFQGVNPATGRPLRAHRGHGEREVERALARAAATFPEFRGLSFDERATRMRRAADLLEEEKEDLGRLVTEEMGKTLRSAVAEAEKCAWACRFYARHAERFLAEEVVLTDAVRSAVRYEPLGPILAIMPWNFPLWQVVRFAAPALMAGNVALLKHAPNVPGCARALEDVFRRAGFPEGAFQTLLVAVERVPGIIHDPRVRAVTLTGSREAGRAVAAEAGRALKKAVLELGGSDPFVVLPSADLERTVANAVEARSMNAGQSCIAAKRIIVHEDVADAFQERFVNGMAALRVGDPMAEDTDLGPLAREDLRDRLEEQVARSVDAGARVLTGGRRADGPGFFYEPTVLAEIPEGSPAREDELFGPVAALFRVPDLEEAIRLANETPFGLGASAWTEDERERARLLSEIEAGVVFITGKVASDPRLPFGGVKESGYGRELGVHGIREFVNVKTVWVAGDTSPPAGRHQPE